MVVKVMFRITNIQTRQQETCPNRDDLLSIINEKSVWAEDRRESFTLQLDQLAEDGSLLDSKTLPLPLQTIVEDALSGFGLKREKKGLPFLSRNKAQKTVSIEEATQEAEQELVELISAPQEEAEEPKMLQEEGKAVKVNKEKIQIPKKQKVPKAPKVQKSPSQAKNGRSSGGLVWKVFAIGALGLSLGSFALIQNQAKTIKSLENRISLEENQGKVEVVGRFFIANYYSGNNDNLNDFLSKDLKAEGVEVKSGQQVQSTIFESAKESKGVISMTYVVTTKADDGSIKTVRLTLPFKQTKKSVYGYVLDGQPKFSSFGD